MLETTTDLAGAQTEFLPRPGAVSFKRLLDGALCPDARARRAPPGGRARPTLGSCFWAPPGRGRCAARQADSAAVGWWGAASCCSLARLAFGAPRTHRTKNQWRKDAYGVGRAPPNGSRLSCGRNARGRKAVEWQTKRLAGEAT